MNTETTTTQTTEQTRQKPGRKPIADKKIAVSIYVRKSDVMKQGGLRAVRENLNNYMNSLI